MTQTRFDMWYGRGRIAAMQSLGFVDLIWQFFFVPSAQPLLVTAGGVLLGLPIAKILDRALA